MEKIHNNASELNCPNGIKNLETWRNAKLEYFHALADAKAMFDLAERVAHERRESARATWHASSHFRSPRFDLAPSNLPCDSCFAGCQNYLLPDADDAIARRHGPAPFPGTRRQP